MPKAPFIIIGMHRSGTSFLARVLEKSGIFMGVFKDHNFEAIHFLSLNQQTLRAASASWDKPKIPEKKFWKTLPAKDLYKEHFKLQGKWSYWRTVLLNPKWGWKDPRNTFTLNMWLSVFPNAKVIHIVRDKPAVVKSLKARNSMMGEVFSVILSNDLFCNALYDEYVTQANSYKNALAKNYLQLSYEKLVNHDKETINKLESFCGVSVKKALKQLSR